MDDATEQGETMARILVDVATQTHPRHEEQSFDISDWTPADVQTWLKRHNLQHLQIWCHAHVTSHTESAIITMGVSVAQRLGRRTYDLAVMRSIPGPGVIRHVGQLAFRLPEWVNRAPAFTG